MAVTDAPQPSCGEQDFGAGGGMMAVTDAPQPSCGEQDLGAAENGTLDLGWLMGVLFFDQVEEYRDYV